VEDVTKMLLAVVEQTKSKTIFRLKKGEIKMWSWAPKECPTPRRIGRLTAGHNINSTGEDLD
jgi:hypothetical protein